MSQIHLISSPIVEGSTIYYKNLSIHLTRKSYQRALYLHIQDNKLIVTCNQSTSLKEIGDFIDDHLDWIERECSEIQRQNKKYPRKQFIQGEQFPFCGELKTLKFCEGRRPYFSIEEETLYAYSPKKMESQEWFPYLIQFYKSEGKSILKTKVDYWSSQMNLYPKKLSFRSQKTIFGSCCEDGNISLNWTLVTASHSVMDYVVIHELAHLKYMDHSAVFWALVQLHKPDYSRDKKWLKDHHLYFNFLQVK